MIKVITYGTYDLFHYGHQRLLERAKSLGDYLIVGVTADDYDMARGKINVQQSLIERMDSVRSTGLADEIIIEEYEGQKIDDILRFDIDVFAIGSDWNGKFDYLKEYCKVVYLERTTGVSSTDLRSEKQALRLGLVGDVSLISKFEKESHYVNGLEISGLCTNDIGIVDKEKNLKELQVITNNYEILLSYSDAVYILSHPSKHYEQIKRALEQGKHVLCESPVAVNTQQWEELFSLAKDKGLVLMDAVRTAYSMAYYRMLLLVKSGVIGNVVSIDSSCTSLRDTEITGDKLKYVWNSICSWGPCAMLPIFQMLGTEYRYKQITSHLRDEPLMYDTFTKISFVFPNAVASIKVGKGVKTEGELVVSGTKGYIYVPAPWWKTEYFEIRREDPAQNKRYYYQLDGEGIRYELVSFIKAIRGGCKTNLYIKEDVSLAIVKIIQDYYEKKEFQMI